MIIPHSPQIVQLTRMPTSLELLDVGPMTPIQWTSARYQILRALEHNTYSNVLYYCTQTTFSTEGYQE